MKIKRLEIHGFKSFVDRASLDFPAGITAVVGPNGCGKSNIVDAIRWVIGEQSAKNLRGKSMEDIIFGGSDSRKPLGMAEVTITFSTEDGRVPAKYLAFSEIQVTRRYYRDGESEYLLNKVPCRLLDIAELFMDTGVGAKAYSIIEQGKIGQILHAKPEERRFLIEEAAGVTKFKARKKVALRKIDATRQNLQRLADIIGEIRRQLGALQRQAKRAEQYRGYREELRGIDKVFLVTRYRELSVARSNGEQLLAEQTLRAEQLTAQMEQGELQLAAERLAMTALEQELATAQNAHYQLKAELLGLEGRREVHSNDLLALERQVGRCQEELTEIERRLGTYDLERRGLTDQQGLFAVDVAEELAGLHAAEVALEVVAQAEVQTSIRLEEVRQQLFRILGEAAQLGNRQSSARKRIAALHDALARSQRETRQLHEEQEAATAQTMALELAVAGILADKEQLAEENARTRSREAQLRDELVAREREFQARRDELSRATSRLHSLQELAARFEGYGQGVRTLLTASEFSGRFQGVLADHLEVSAEDEIALEAVLGDRLQHIVCTVGEDSQQAIDFLRARKGGRSGFLLPVGSRSDASFPTVDNMVPLDELVKVADSFADRLQPLLQGVYLAPGLSEALAAAARHPALSFVTRDGDVVLPGGAVVGGAREAVAHGVIHRKREIRELAAQVASLETVVAATTAERERVKKELLATEEHGRHLRQRLHDAELQLVNHQKDLQRSREGGQRLKERLSLLGHEMAGFEEELAALTRELAETDAGLEEGASRRAILEGEQEGLHAEVAGIRQELANAREALTERKVRVASLNERQEAAQQALVRLVHQQDEQEGRRRLLHKELATTAEQRLQLHAALEETEKAIAGQVQAITAAESTLAKLRERCEDRTQWLRAEEDRLRLGRSEVEEVRSLLASQGLALSELGMELRHLEQTVQERFRTSPAELAAELCAVEYDEVAMRCRQEELERLVTELGEVNLLAIEEHRQMEERHGFLVAQQQDLQESLKDLQQAIGKINRTTRRRFQETFDLVNMKFQEIFPRLFCGGRGELRLTGEEDLLECGIDIVVEPPGKKLQSVTLLSGGEKALTAVALIFSIFLIKPTPFCLLDEVDAPLDDANIGRFNEMVREMSATSQFIIITHNRTTMGVADTLYGVTMEEAGVSKLVSVRMQ